MEQSALRDWVAQQHRGQLIRRTTEPYINHLLRVAEMAAPYISLGYEVGLCHDLPEKTGITPQSLFQALRQINYAKNEAEQITDAVVELTDVYTKVDYPELKKKLRKVKEEERLLTISPLAQTVKYADLYDNILWMVRFDREKAPAYLERKKDLIIKMVAGNPVLQRKVLELISSF